MTEGRAAAPASWGAYVHLPFCASRCPYCDFASSTDLKPLEDVLGAISVQAYQGRAVAPVVDSLYFGGGTPSIIPTSALRDLFLDLRADLPFTDDLEFTVELNPADVTDDLVDVLREIGVTRLSLGVQALDDESLRFLRRRHTARGAVEAFKRLRAGGDWALSVDLMSCLPGQTAAGWARTLDAALALAPDHLSTYELTLAPGTPLAARVERGEVAPVKGDAAAEIVATGHERLDAAGWDIYEVSNAARTPALRSRHNQKYWRGIPWLGLGPAAHGFDGSTRRVNKADARAYADALLGGRSPVASEDPIDAERARLERLFLGLRTSDGVPRSLVEDDEANQTSMKAFIEEGLLRRDGEWLRPTLAGMRVADGMARVLG
jgi:oxygen-independent coproporphyrinogen III oxidase